MHVYLGSGDQRKALVENLKDKTADHQSILLEYLPKADVTLLYVIGYWGGPHEEAVIGKAYDKEWLHRNFLGFGSIRDVKKGFELDRMGSDGMYYSHEITLDGLGQLYKIKQDYYRDEIGVSCARSIDESLHCSLYHREFVLVRLSPRIKKERIKDVRRCNPGSTTPVFKKIHTIGEYLKIKPLYRIQACEEGLISRTIYTISFNTLGELKSILIKDGWTSFARGDYRYEGGYEVSYERTPVKDINLKHVLFYPHFVGFKDNHLAQQ